MGSISVITVLTVTETEGYVLYDRVFMHLIHSFDNMQCPAHSIALVHTNMNTPTQKIIRLSTLFIVLDCITVSQWHGQKCIEL